jgi:FAD/FMN-containing dehydrogenase
VVAAVNFARESGLDLAVRGGSHSVPGFGTADDAVVIDLSRMQAVARPRSTRRQQIGAAHRWIEAK